MEACTSALAFAALASWDRDWARISRHSVTEGLVCVISLVDERTLDP
jgi:hypothetical protein